MSQLYIAVAIAVGAFGAGWTVHGWKEDAAALAAEDAVKKARSAFQTENAALADRLEKRLANLKIVNRTITNEVQREVQTKTVYVDRNCATPDSGVSLLNAARGYADSRPAGERDGALPAATEGKSPAAAGR